MLKRSYIIKNGKIEQTLRSKKKRKTSLTSIHRQLILICKELKLRYVIEKKFGRYKADIYLPDYNIILEADGSYWHNLNKKRDRIRDIRLERDFKVKVYRFSDIELENEPRTVFSKLKEITTNK